MKIAIVTDSTAVMHENTIRDHKNLYTIPLQILMGDDVYKDGVDITPSEFFGIVDKQDVLPTTSQPSVGDVLDMFEDLLKEYDEVIYITISSKISGTYTTGLLAKNQLPEKNIHVFDSLSTSVVQQRLVLEAIRMAQENMTGKEIIETLEMMKENTSIYLVVDDLKHLGRTGRVSNVSAVVGAMLKIKPILTFKQGEINLKSKIRTITKAHNEVINILKETDINDKSFIMIAHADAFEYVDSVKEKIQNIYPEKEIVVSELSPVISVHTGPKTLGVAWIK